MVTEEHCETDDHLSYPGVCLADEPLCPANITLLPKVKKILPESQYEAPRAKSRPCGAKSCTRGFIARDKNLKLNARRCNPRIHFLNRRLPNYLKKEHREMKRTVFGYELIMDLGGCDVGIISSKKKLQTYAIKLCELIRMKRYKEALIPYFGEKKAYTKGYSLVQLIETSSITGHFSEYWKTAYINIFSCKKYNYNLAKNFTRKFFKAGGMKARLLTR